jgi:hypothetical protein
VICGRRFSCVTILLPTLEAQRQCHGKGHFDLAA